MGMYVFVFFEGEEISYLNRFKGRNFSISFDIRFPEFLLSS